jgi:hypothetical protein
MSSNFTPLSSQLGIAGTSYRLQLGMIGSTWAARLLKGNDVVASTTINELNGNLIVGFVIKETAIPNLNPYQIMKTVEFIVKEARANEGRMKQGGIPAPGPEVKARAQAAEAKHQSRAPARAPAPVTSQPPVDSELASEEDTRASYRIIPKAREEAVTEELEIEGAEMNWGETVILGEGRELQPIPSASEESAPAPKKAAAASIKTSVKGAAPPVKAPVKAVAKANAAGTADQLSKIEERLSAIEERLSAIEERLDQS